MGGGELVTLFVDPMMSEPSKLLDALQINFLQPFYNFTFANGLIACLVFMGLCNACPIVLRCALCVERRQSIKIDGATIYFFDGFYDTMILKGESIWDYLYQTSESLT